MLLVECGGVLPFRISQSSFVTLFVLASSKTMWYSDESRHLRRSWFILRVALSCFTVPLAVPVTFFLQMAKPLEELNDGILSTLVIVLAVGVPVMILVGIPLLLLYLRCGLIGFFPFLLGGGLCAAAASQLILQGPAQSQLFGFYFMAGLLGGLLFRLILFGLDPTLIGRHVGEEARSTD